MLSSIKYTVLLNVLLFVVTECKKGKIEVVDDNHLIQLLSQDTSPYLITVFTKDDCIECTELENLIESFLDDLKETISPIVVKAHNSQLINIYDPSREPSLIYFRKGIPLIYYGQLNKDEILQTFSENKEPAVKELSDSNFEHLTQSSTGATTGDWFIFFYSADCILCQRLYAVWETVGAILKHKLTAARVNRVDAGLSTAKRFGVEKSPYFIFIRQGKFYEYGSTSYSPRSLIEFAQSGYKKLNIPKAIPPVPNFIDELFTTFFWTIAVHPKFITCISIASFVVILAVSLLKMLSNKKQSKSKTKPNKKKST